MLFFLLLILLIFGSVRNFIFLIEIPEIPYLPVERVIDIFKLVSDKKTKLNFQLALRSDLMYRNFDDVFSKKHIKTAVKNVLEKAFNTRRVIEFKGLNSIL